MSVEQAHRVRELFDAAADLTGGLREEFLERECGSDAGLRARVESLLALDNERDLPLDRAVFEGPLDPERFADVKEFKSGDLAHQLPEKIGRYRILGLLGVGGMGVVYKAEQDAPRRLVALKTLRPGMAGRRIVARFHNEIRTLARLKHIGIAQIYDAGTAQTAWGNQPYLAMELVEGLSLLEHANARYLATRDRLQLFAGLCDAVQFAHQHGVIHRDLKPTNILVVGDEIPQPKVLDFGVSRLLDRDAQCPTLATAAGELVGTLTYMSPEQLGEADADVDSRSDVYSLGVILYELLAGKPPIEVAGTSLTTAAARIRRDDPPPLSRVSREFAGDVEIIVAKALAKDRTRRYESAAALAHDVRRYLANWPIASRPESLGYVLRKFARRNRAAVAVAGLFGVAVIGGVAGTLYGLVQAQREAALKHKLLEAAVESVATIGSEVVPRLDHLVGTAGPRRILQDQLLRMNDLLNDSGVDSQRLRAAHVDIIQSISDVDRSEERRAEALEQRREALRLREQLVARDPTDIRQRRKLAINHVLVGDILKEGGDAASAEACYRTALDIQKQVAREVEPGMSLLEELSFSYVRISSLAIGSGRLDEAERLLGQGAQIIERMRSIAAQPEDMLDSLQSTHSMLATLYYRLDRPKEAAAHVELRLNYIRELMALHPTNRDYAHSLAGALICAASDRMQEDQCEAALRLSDEADYHTNRLARLNRGDRQSLDLRLWHLLQRSHIEVGSSRVDLQACKLEYSIVSPK